MGGIESGRGGEKTAKEDRDQAPLLERAVWCAEGFES